MVTVMTLVVIEEARRIIIEEGVEVLLPVIGIDEEAEVIGDVAEDEAAEDPGVPVLGLAFTSTRGKKNERGWKIVVASVLPASRSGMSYPLPIKPR
jgi:hypothetical protein